MFTPRSKLQRQEESVRDTDFVARLHRNFALLGGQLKNKLKHCVVLSTLVALFETFLMVIPFYG